MTPPPNATARSAWRRRCRLRARGRDATAPGRLILVHTEVPEHLAGRGIGGSLVRAALDRAASDHLTIVPRCPFARRWLKNHHATGDL